MNVWESFLDNRPDKHAGRAACDAWMLEVLAPAERLLAFDGWVKSQLAKRLQWPADDRRRVKMIGQCATRLEKITLELWRRGWQLDGKALARHILAALDDIAAAQVQGRVKDFWPFYCGVIDRYVGLHAEEIQAEARRLAGPRLAGDVIQQALRAAQPSIPALVAQRRDEINTEKTLRGQLKAVRLKKDSSESQGTLF